ncbi:SKA complex subunit 2 isoform X1 [Stigmatopora nigra]
METTVEKLGCMFSKSEADLDVIEKRLKLELINHTEENGFSREESTVVMLERLGAIKEKHKVLRSQMIEVAAAQKRSILSIQDNLNSLTELVQHFQQTTSVKCGKLEAQQQTEKPCRVMNTAQKIIGCSLPSLDDIAALTTSVEPVTLLGRDPYHPGHNLFKLLPSGRRYRSHKTRTN